MIGGVRNGGQWRRVKKVPQLLLVLVLLPVLLLVLLILDGVMMTWGHCVVLCVSLSISLSVPLCRSLTRHNYLSGGLFCGTGWTDRPDEGSGHTHKALTDANTHRRRASPGERNVLPNVSFYGPHQSSLHEQLQSQEEAGGEAASEPAKGERGAVPFTFQRKKVLHRNGMEWNGMGRDEQLMPRGRC